MQASSVVAHCNGLSGMPKPPSTLTAVMRVQDSASENPRLSYDHWNDEAGCAHRRQFAEHAGRCRQYGRKAVSIATRLKGSAAVYPSMVLHSGRQRCHRPLPGRMINVRSPNLPSWRCDRRCRRRRRGIRIVVDSCRALRRRSGCRFHCFMTDRTTDNQHCDTYCTQRKDPHWQSPCRNDLPTGPR